MDLDTVVDELYGLAPDEFTAARDARSRVARPVDRALSDEIHKLRRPSLSAWALNAFVRGRRGEIDQLLALGEQLRRAQAALAGDELRQLLAQRRQLVAAVTTEVRQLAMERGQPLNERARSEVAQTLEAALADAEAAAALASGRLVTALSHVGIGGLAFGTRPLGSVATPGAAAAPGRPATDERLRGDDGADRQDLAGAGRGARVDSERVERDRQAALEAQRQAELAAERQLAERALGEARLDLRRARERVETAKRRMSGAGEQRERARRHADSLAGELLRAARERERDAETACREAGAALGLAEDEERDASRRADEAEESLARLSTS